MSQLFIYSIYKICKQKCRNMFAELLVPGAWFSKFIGQPTLKKKLKSLRLTQDSNPNYDLEY